jgi:hypothetical protein
MPSANADISSGLLTRQTAGPWAVALAGLVSLALAMGIGRFAFTPLPMMLHDGTVTLAEGGALATLNYIGYLLGALLCLFIRPDPVRMVRGAGADRGADAGHGAPGRHGGVARLAHAGRYRQRGGDGLRDRVVYAAARRTRPSDPWRPDVLRAGGRHRDHRGVGVRHGGGALAGQLGMDDVRGAWRGHAGAGVACVRFAASALHAPCGSAPTLAPAPTPSSTWKPGR